MKISKLIFVDIETSGLNPDTDQMLEIAVVVTDTDLNIQGGTSRVISPLLGLHPETWPDVVRKMHEKNGLLNELRAGAGVPHFQAEQEILDTLLPNVKSQESPMCGSSVHFDRAFMRLQMPTLNKFFHYRNMDTSTFKSAVNLWAPKDAYPFMPDGEKPHRAMEDVKASIAELSYYRNLLFH